MSAINISENPPRKITPEVKRFADLWLKNKAILGGTGLYFIFMGLLFGGISYSIIVFETSTMDQIISNPNILIDNLPRILNPPFPQGLHYTFCGICFVFSLLGISLFLLSKRNQKRYYKNLFSTWKNGQMIQGTILSQVVNYNLKLNNRPQLLIQVKFNEEEITITTFDQMLYSILVPGSTMDFLWHEDNPDMYIPIPYVKALLSGQASKKRKVVGM